MNAPIDLIQALPDGLLDDRLAFIGQSGSGKTYAAKGLCERLIRAGYRVCVVDLIGHWWGLRAGADGSPDGGLPVTIFGGTHGDVPITEEDGPALAHVVAHSDIRCIIDLSELDSDAAARRFMLAFAGTLYSENRNPLHFIVDEADFFAPQTPRGDDGPSPALLGRMSQIVRRGRGRGFITWLISQRPAVLNKNVLSQAQALVVMALTISQDRDAIGAWISGQADIIEGKRILGELARLLRGSGYVWAPRHGILQLVDFPKSDTFDSSRAPDRGEMSEVTTLRPVDVTTIAAALAKGRKPKADGKTDIPEAQADAGYQQGLAEGRAEAIPLRDQIRQMQAAITGALGHLIAHVDRLANGDVLVIDVVSAQQPPMIEARVVKPSDVPVRMATDRPASGKAELRILKALAQRHPARFTARQWATLAGVKPTTGTWRNYLSKLRVAGYLLEGGGTFGVTPAGLRAAEVVLTRPKSPAEVRIMWKHAVGGQPGRMIDILYRTPGMTREALAHAMGISHTTGTFRNYLSKLRSNGLLQQHGDTLMLAEMLLDG